MGWVSYTSWCLTFIITMAQPYEYTCPGICNCSSLQELTDCRYNELVALPENIYIDVVRLDLSNNYFTGIPQNVTQFKLLTWLNLSHNKISVMDKSALENFSELKYLYMTNNQFASWADIDTQVLVPAKKLTLLDLSHNSLKGFPDIVDEHLISTSLRNLYLVNCSITNINSDIIEGLTSLTLLDLSLNNVDVLNAQIKSKTLLRLNLNNSGLQKIHNAFYDLTALHLLNIAKNTQLKFFASTSTSVKQLVASDCDLDTLSRINFPDLREAIFRGNHLKTLQEYAFKNMSKIERIDLSHNTISFIDVKAFNDAKTLTYVDLSYNTISVLDPKTFDSNFKLVTLKLSHNYLREVVDLEIESLKDLDMSMCEIGTIRRNSLLKVPLLESFNLSTNFLASIPDDFEADKLYSLDLSFCRITTLSNRTFALMENLRRLDLRSNRLTSNLKRAYFHNVDQLYLGDNSWRCDCSDLEFRNFYEFLIQSNMRVDAYDLICQTPEHLEGLRWGTACYETWTVVDARGDKAWMYSLIFVVTLIFLFCIILSIKRAIRVRENRERDIRAQNIADARERLQRMRIQERESRQEESRNAPDPRESQRPPPYDEAILLPKLDSSHPSLMGSRASLASRDTLSGSRQNLSASTPDLKKAGTKRRRKRRRAKAASSEDLRSTTTYTTNTTEHSTSDTEQNVRIYMESNV